jgi:mucin-19
MSYIQNLFTSRDNNAQGNTYVGQEGRIWWNPDTNAFYYSDGNTAGGIPIGSGGGGPGVPGGPTNSIQYNLGGGSFGGTANLVVSGAGLSATGNITAAWFIGNVSTTGNVVAGNVLTNNYLYANGASIFANTTFTGNIDLGNLYIDDQTIGGKNLNANITLLPEGDGWVSVPKIVLDGMTIANTGGKIQFDTAANVDIQFEPGVGGNILTAGNIKPTGNNIAGIGDASNRYTGLWLGAGNINLIDQTLSQNQQIYANNGNLIIANASGLSFGNFLFYGNTMALANAAANIIVGTANATGWVQFNRAIAVSTIAGETAFSVNKNGLTEIRTPATISNTQSALNIIGSSSGNSQPRNFSGTMIQVTGQDNEVARVSFDAFGANGAQNSYTAIASRAARGTVDSPTALQANDLMMRLTNQGWTGNGVYAASIARLNFAAAEAFTSNAAVGTYANIQLTPIGSNVIKTITGFSGNGINFPSSGAGGTGNLGITFQDGTFQNTAFSNTQVVTSATAATGITVTPATTGNITITNTGVITVAGTANQIFVGGANVIAPANGVVQLSLPQDIAPSSSPTFNNLTVTNLSIIGNVSNVIPAVVDGPIVYVANTANSFPNINNSGLITGNAANSVYAGILYQTGGLYANTWDMTIGNSVGIFAGNLEADNANVDGELHVGNAAIRLEYPYAVIQGDMDENSYTQIVLQNHNQGGNASADFVAVNNIGTDSNNYIDMGINSNVYNNADYAVTKPNDGYLYVNGGNLIIGTQTAAKTISFFTGGTNSASFIRGTISDTGLSIVGNVTANNFISNSIVTTNGISATGNITGNNIFSLNVVSAQGNVIGQNLLTTGIISATANVTGGNIRTAGSITATGNITGGNLITATTVIDGGVSTSGNITGANIVTSGTVSATGNINGANIVANLAVISDTLSILGNIQGGNLLTAGIISTSGNATFGNVQTTGRISITGNVDAGNVRTAGAITATGNVSTAGFFVGDGGFISNITVPTATKIVNGTSWANIAASGGNLVIAIAGGTVGTISSGGANITGYANATGNVAGGNLVGQNLTPTRVTFVGSGKEIDDDAEFTYNDTTNTLSVGNISASGNVTAAFFNGNGSGLTGTVGGSRYYGQFWDTTTQNNGGATTANPMTFNTSDAFNTGVSITVGNTSHVVIANPGVYNLQFSAQFAKTDSGQDTVSVWLAKDGVNVADSCTDLDLNNNNARAVAAWNWLVNPTVANTYYQIYWSSADTNMSIFAEGTRINPTRPAIPSVILTVTQA